MVGPRRLIEVDLPIKEISKHARREKSIRHGHISTLHIWWARRPLAACRAVVLASLLPDPEDTACPKGFSAEARDALARVTPASGDTPEEVRDAIFKFIASFSAWENSTNPAYLDCARALVRAAYPGGSPLVVDPFAGGGSIPLEALRVGAEAWAGDQNAVATVLLKTLLEEMPVHGEKLAAGIKEWGSWVETRGRDGLASIYPSDPDGALPIVYIWARTVRCEGPGCGSEIPLIAELSLTGRGKPVFLRILVDQQARTVDFELGPTPTQGPTVKGGAAVCPACDFVTSRPRVQVQLASRGGGTSDARLIAIVLRPKEGSSRIYRIANETDTKVAAKAREKLERSISASRAGIPLVPDGALNPTRPSPAARGVSAVTRYGMARWGDLFLPRQLLTLSCFSEAVTDAGKQMLADGMDPSLAKAVTTCLALGVDRLADRLSSLARWDTSRDIVTNTFSKQALAMVRDFAEVNPFSGETGGWKGAIEWIEKVCLHVTSSRVSAGRAMRADARDIPIPDSSAACVFTDPPYYDQIPYSDLSDFFLEWLTRSVGHLHAELSNAADKSAELVVNAGHKTNGEVKDKRFFRREMGRALKECRRILSEDGIAIFVFAHKETEGWEALLSALLSAGWTVTGSWPIETEMANRVRAQKAASLQSSIHIVCRPRPEGAGTGDWRVVRPQMEQRVADWLPRLSSEGIEGADAIFACLGPALEVFSQYERVETASGDAVPLSPPETDPTAPAFLPAVWAAIAKEALKMIFEGPEAEGFEEDARLTALWLWTLRAALDGTNGKQEETAEDEEGADEKPKKLAGLALDYDTARKLAQALGVDLEELGRPGGIVEIKGSAARLIPVPERRRVLLGRDATPAKKGGTLFDTPDESLSGSIEGGETTLDRLHQAMLLFADGRGEVLRRFLAESSDQRSLRLARALSALYPATSSEKRWVDGVLAAHRQGS